MPVRKLEATFSTEEFWTLADAQRATFAGPDAIVRVLKHGSDRFIQFCGSAGASGPAFNDAGLATTTALIVECYFGVDPEFWTSYDTQRAEYAGPGAQFKIFKAGKHRLIQFCDADGNGGDPLNDSLVCPGSPRC
jgi:hypothetical protein